MAAIERRQREMQRRMDEVIAAAEDVFAQKSFDAASMDEIAETAEFSKQTLYKYFQSKEELLAAAASRGIDRLYSMIEDEISKTEDKSAIEQLFSLGVAFVSFHEKYAAQHALVEEFFAKSYSETAGEYAARCSEAIQKIHMTVEGIVRRGQTEGSIRKDMDSMKIVVSISAMFRGVTVLTSKAKDFFTSNFKISYNEIMENSIKLLAKALSCENESEDEIRKNGE